MHFGVDINNNAIYTHDHGPAKGEQPATAGTSRARIAFVVFLAIALFFLVTEHRAHFLGVLPYLLILACPLMHLSITAGMAGAQRLATTGIYARTRHPQYVAFVLIMFGFLLQWPTLLTLAMFPVLVVMYAYLSRREEADMEAQFGEAYKQYASRTPRFLPGRAGGTRSA